MIRSYYLFTKELLHSKRTYGSLHSFVADDCERVVSKLEHRYNSVFSWKKLPKFNTVLPFGTWLIDSVFPRPLYEENNCKLSSMLQDERFFTPPSSFHTKGTYHNFLGRMSRPRNLDGSKYIGFLDYMLDRWKRGNHRSMPHYFFPVESPEWVFEELMRNPNQIKSGRTALACVMNLSFRWDKKNERLVLSVILKHTQWHHTMGDFCGGALIANAVTKELRIVSPPAVNIFLTSASLDYQKEARQIVEDMEGMSEMQPSAAMARVL